MLFARRAHRSWGSPVAFNSWLNKVNEGIRPDYLKAYESLTELNNWANEKKAFRLITCSRRVASGEYERLPSIAYQYDQHVLALYRHYRIAGMPKAKPIRLTTDHIIRRRSHGGRVESLLFNAHVSDFKIYLKEVDVARVVARNIRFNLGKRVGRDIRETYEKSPEDFWYRHNGISMVCDSLVNRNGYVELQNPSVINGAQTLYAIHGAIKMKKTALVTVRVLVRHHDGGVHQEDDQWLQSVIRGVNTQNKVQALDFLSNEPEQFELQRLFRAHHVYYERKRGEWNNVKNDPKHKGFRRLSLRTLASILTATSEDTGRGVLVVKRGLERAFQDRRHYDKLFGGKKAVQRKFKRFYLAYCLFRFLNEHGYKDAKTFQKQRHGFWNCLWLAHLMLASIKGIPEQCSLASIYEGFEAFEARTQVGRHARKVMKQLTAAAWRAYRKGRVKDRDHWTPNNFFKETYGNQCLKRYVVPTMKKEVASLAKYLLK